jgi:protein Tob/BTG
MTKSSSNRKRRESTDSQEEAVSAEFVIDPAMKAEIEAAVGFLTDFLVKATKQEFSSESVDLFRRSLQSVLYRRYQGHWHSANPLRGSGFRCLRINGKLDPLVKLAAESCRLSLRKVRKAFPAELTVWVDPGEVSVRFGEEGSVGVWYAAARRAGDEEEQQRQAKIPDPHQIHQQAYSNQQMYQQRSSPTLSSTPPNAVSFPHAHQQPTATNGYHQRLQYQSSPIQYQRQQSSPVWNPHWQQPQQQQQNAAFSPQQNRSSPSSFVSMTPNAANNNGFVMALNHQQQQQMQLRQQQTPIRYNTTTSLSSSPSSRVSPQPIVEATSENGEEQRCKMLAERLMRENLNLMASLAPGLVSTRPQPVGVGVN